jgi:site-specific DNA-methyltransferase (adenine-specific)
MKGNPMDGYDAAENSRLSYEVGITACRDRLASFRKEVIGECTLYLGDCREVLPLLPAVDAIITDPPYGIALEPQRRLTKAIAGDGRGEARALWDEVVRLSYGLAKPNTGHLFWTGWSEVWTKEVLAEQFTVKSCVVWAKNMWGIGFYTRPQHEFAWYCHKGTPTVPADADSDLWQVPKIQAPIHSCEKPTALMKRAVRLCSRNPGDLVLDPFMGVGATGVACVKMGRRFIGIELDETYFEVSCRRIEEAYKQPDMFVSTPQPKAEQVDMLGLLGMST